MEQQQIQTLPGEDRTYQQWNRNYQPEMNWFTRHLNWPYFLGLKVRNKKKEGQLEETDYRAFVVMGIAWLPGGFIGMLICFLFNIPIIIGMPLLAIGLTYLIIGLANRHRWKKSS